MGRAVSVTDLYTKKFKVLEFEGEWESLIGKPELKGSWIIWGASGNGKTRFTLMLCKYLTRFGKVAYNSLEEGFSLSMKQAFIATGMEEVKKSIVLLDQESIEDLKIRLSKKKSPHIIVIDSIQYTGLTYKGFVKLKEQFPNKLFICISHADGKKPRGNTAKSIEYDSFVKIRVEGFMAQAVSRFGGGQDYTIWQEGADRYWTEK